MSVIIYLDRLFLSVLLYTIATFILCHVLTKTHIAVIKLLILSLTEAGFMCSCCLVYVQKYYGIDFLPVPLTFLTCILHSSFLRILIILLNVAAITYFLTGFGGTKIYLGNYIIVLASGLGEIGIFFIIYTNFYGNYNSYGVRIIIFVIVEAVILCILARAFNEMSILNNSIEILLVDGENIIGLKALIDSGNRLRNPGDNKPVTILSADVRKKLTAIGLSHGESFSLKCQTISGEKNLTGMYFDELHVKFCKKELIYKNMPMVFSDELTFDGRYQAIISNALAQL